MGLTLYFDGMYVQITIKMISQEMCLYIYGKKSYFRQFFEVNVLVKEFESCGLSECV